MNLKIDAALVLLYPAWRRWGSARTVNSGTVILHSQAADVIPFADSQELLHNSGLPESALIVVGHEHRLGLAAAGEWAIALRRFNRGRKGNEKALRTGDGPEATQGDGEVAGGADLTALLAGACKRPGPKLEPGMFSSWFDRFDLGHEPAAVVGPAGRHDAEGAVAPSWTVVLRWSPSQHSSDRVGWP
jgi:hypothetical protein